MWDTIILILGIWFLLGLFVVFVDHWPFVLFVAGVILINMFTLWAVVVIFLLGLILQIYAKAKNKNHDNDRSKKEIIVNSLLMTVAIVVVALIINLILQYFWSIGGSGELDLPCTRMSPQGC